MVFLTPHTAGGAASCSAGLGLLCATDSDAATPQSLLTRDTAGGVG